MTETRPERRLGILPRIVSTTARWLRERWNRIYYGFPEGRPARDKMNTLLNQERLGLKGMAELSELLGRTSSGRLVFRMAEKINNESEQL